MVVGRALQIKMFDSIDFRLFLWLQTVDHRAQLYRIELAKSKSVRSLKLIESEQVKDQTTAQRFT